MELYVIIFKFIDIKAYPSGEQFLTDKGKLYTNMELPVSKLKFLLYYI